MYSYNFFFHNFKGTWFWQAGFILFPPSGESFYPWEPNNHGHIMLITISFCWHLIFILVFLFIELAIISRLYNGSRWFSNRCDELIGIDDDEGTFSARGMSEGQRYFTMLGQDEDDEIFDRSKLLPDF